MIYPATHTQKHSLEAEQEVLETIMHFADPNNVRVQKAMLKLDVDCFYDPDNKEIYKIIRKCFDQGENFHFVDILTLVPLHLQEIHNSLNWLIENYNKCHVGESGFERYVDKIVTLSQLRKQIALADKMIKSVNECLVPEEAQIILADSLTEIAALSYRQSKHGISNIQIAEDYYDGKIEESNPIPTMCPYLNNALNGGIMPKSYILVAAGSGVGKTGFSIFLMDRIARAQPGKESLFYSLEMEYKHIWMRHVGICAGIPFDQLSYDIRMKAVTHSVMVPMKVYDTAMCRQAADIDFIVTTARLRAMETKISVIVVDYLGLVECSKQFENNHLKQTYIHSQLAQLAIELDCTVIGLSQINRSSASRGVEDRCPWPHDAADSSGGHRSSSLWLGVDRPQLYMDDPIYRNQFVVKCRKNRFGDLFDLTYAFNNGTFGEYIRPRTYEAYAVKQHKEEELFA